MGVKSMYSLTGVYILNKAKEIANFGNFGGSKDCCLMGIKHKKRGNYPQKRTKTHKRNLHVNRWGHKKFTKN